MSLFFTCKIITCSRTLRMMKLIILLIIRNRQLLYCKTEKQKVKSARNRVFDHDSSTIYLSSDFTCWTICISQCQHSQAWRTHLWPISYAMQRDIKQNQPDFKKVLYFKDIIRDLQDVLASFSKRRVPSRSWQRKFMIAAAQKQKD